MKKIVILLLVLLLLAGAGFGGWKYYQSLHIYTHDRYIRRDAALVDMQAEALTPEDYEELHALFPKATILWNVPFQGSTYPLDTREVTLSALTAEEVPLLAYLPRLQTVHADGCRDFDALLALQDRLPDCEVLAPVSLCGESFNFDTTELNLADADEDSLEAALPCLPLVTRVHLTGDLPEGEALLRLRANHPDIAFTWELSFADQLWTDATETIDLSGIDLRDAGEIAAVLARLPALCNADFTDTGLTDAQMMALADQFPGTFFLWDITFGPKTFPTDASLIDISRHTISDAGELEARLKYLPKLKKVIMSFCGISDEDMDALNRRHDDVRFVWTVTIDRVQVRTDETTFMPFKQHDWIETRHVYPLRYCTDMVCVDIGHMAVGNCEWAAYMPNLKYLILGETRVSDLTPLSGLKNLVFLELFTIPVTDYSPLLGCTALEDLNLGLTYGNPEPIMQMTWLKHLWWCDAANRNHPYYAEMDKLSEALPNTEIKIRINHPTASGWRHLENYYGMRDVLEMPYLDQ